jgi:hypothetical protein
MREIHEIPFKIDDFLLLSSEPKAGAEESEPKIDMDELECLIKEHIIREVLWRKAKLKLASQVKGIWGIDLEAMA